MEKKISKLQRTKNIIVRYLGIITFIIILIILTNNIVKGLEKKGLLIKDKTICEKCDTIQGNPFPCLLVSKDNPCKTWNGKNMTFILVFTLEMTIISIIGLVADKKILDGFDLQAWLAGK